MQSDASAAPVDILDILLSAPQGEPVPGQEALNRLIRRANAPAGPTTKAAPKKTDKRTPVRPNRKKVKTTHYLDAALHARLATVRNTLAEDKTHPDRLSKSRIVETALRQALADFEAQGPQSRLSRALETTADTACTPEVS